MIENWKKATTLLGEKAKIYPEGCSTRADIEALILMIQGDALGTNKTHSADFLRNPHRREHSLNQLEILTRSFIPDYED